MTPAEDSQSAAVTHYEEFLKEQAAAEESRKAGLEQRGLAVITTSGALATLLLGLAAIVPRAADLPLPRPARTMLLLATCSFFLASMLALLVNAPLRYARLNTKALDLDRLIAEPASAAQRRVLTTRFQLLTRTQRLNDLKAAGLIGAMAVEVLGGFFIAATAAVLLRNA